MKRLVVVLSSLLVLPAFAEVAPSFYTDELVFTDVEQEDIDTEMVEPETVSEQASATNTTTARKQPSVAAARTATSRTSSARTATTRSTTARTPVVATRSGKVQSRSISNRNSTATSGRTTNVSSRRTNATTGNTRPGTTARAAATISSTTPLYNATNTRRSTGVPTVTTRNSSMRVATTTAAATTTADDVIDTTAELDALKSLTEYCQAQYSACMDNYCDVLDDNQGRCSCSKNLANYEKTETALQNATDALQDVARAIQYIGLTAEQITTLFDETEAELTMKNQKDTSAIRSDLDKVKKMIVDVKTTTSSSVDTGTMNFDLSGLLDFSIDSTGFDLSSFMNTNSNTNSISNQRGESLFKTATARCKASVLNSCTAQGVDAAMITNSYDLEIDKSCLAYERALTDSNKQMSQTVANAKEVLKKARLMVAQNKNAYDLRGCVNALESCMQDEYVCGSDYENCLDPTGQYIVNGAVVIGSMPGNNTEPQGTSQTLGNLSTHYSHENLFDIWTLSNKNPWVKQTPNVQDTSVNYQNLAEYIKNNVNLANAKTSSDKLIEFLQNKIGWHDDKNNKDYGMCMNVLNQCQKYTYTTKGNKTTYNGENDVIINFMQRALIQIKAKQDELLASYAEDCINDVSSCLSTNNYDENNPTSTKSRAAVNSCYAQVKTCMSVNGNIYGSVTPTELQTWVTGTYSALESIDQGDTTSIEALCSSITEPETCNATRINLINPNTGAGTVTPNVCEWHTGEGENAVSKCQKAS